MTQASSGPAKMVIPEIKTEEAGAPAEAPTPYNPFNLRYQVLSSLYASHVSSGKLSTRASNGALSRARQGLRAKPADALDAARRLVQDAINKELAGVIDRYVTRFLHPAIANVRANGHPVSEQLIDDLRIQILEEAKQMYRKPPSTASTGAPSTSSAPPAATLTPRKPLSSSSARPKSNSSAAAQPAIVEERLPTRKRAPPQLFSPSVSHSLAAASTSAQDSDQDSDIALPSLGPRARKKPRYLENVERPLSRSSTPGGARPSELTLEDLPKWNPVRVTKETRFILGSKANKALGMGDQRGRIYNKHPRLFKYVSDSEDKDWLYKMGHKSSKGVGRAFLLFLDDVLALAASDGYRTAAGLETSELEGFEVPPFLSDKIRAAMDHEFQRHRVKLES